MKAIPRFIRILRNLALVGLVFNIFQSQAQFDCTISCNLEGDTVVFENDTTVCYKQKAYLFTSFADSLSYSWEPNGETGVIIEVEIKEPITYIVTVYNDDSSFMCTDSITINIYPKIVVEFEQVSKGCPDECKAQVIATASGGMPPYRYYWSAVVAPNDSSLALGLCSDETARIMVKDTLCSFDTTFLVEGYTMPQIEVTVSPDTLYETDPRAKMFFENKSADSIPLTNWIWLFPDSTTTNLIEPEYVFLETDSVHFIYTTIDGCVDTIIVPVEVKEFELTVPNVFTPNGDGANDLYEIPNLERYITSQLIVFNRWGNKVYEANNYTNNWDGDNLPDGVYFYILKCKGYWKEDVFKGSVSIYGSSY